VHICIVDNEYSVGRMVQDTLEPENFRVTYFGSSRDYINRFIRQEHDLLICEVEMPIFDGFSVLEKIQKLHPVFPVILISNHADVRAAVKALKMGAEYFIKKPLQPDHLLSVVKTIRRSEQMLDFPPAQRLTQHEIRVLRLILHGYHNSSIAAILGRSVRTIEDHRNKIMQKLGTKNLVELVKLFMSHTQYTSENLYGEQLTQNGKNK
jgi:FixJ family two-component response regulator